MEKHHQYVNGNNLNIKLICYEIFPQLYRRSFHNAASEKSDSTQNTIKQTSDTVLYYICIKYTYLSLFSRVLESKYNNKNFN